MPKIRDVKGLRLLRTRKYVSVYITQDMGVKGRRSDARWKIMSIRDQILSLEAFFGIADKLYFSTLWGKNPIFNISNFYTNLEQFLKEQRIQVAYPFHLGARGSTNKNGR